MRDSTTKKVLNLISEMPFLSVLLDSCVIFPMPLCDTLLCTAEAELYQVHFSQEILDGATRNLVKKGRMTEAKAVRFQSMIKTHFPEAMVEVPEELVAVMTNHPGDRHVVAAAIVAKAEVIVTYNLKHFQATDLDSWGIEAWHPDDFLVYLDNLFPEKMIQVIRQQLENLTPPPFTIAELLDKLEQSNKVQKFASSIRFREYCDAVVQTAKKVLRSQFANIALEGGRCFDGRHYRIWEGRGILTITAMDNRGEILRVENGEIEGNLSSKDVEAFQIFDRSLEQELARVRNIQQSKLIE